MSDYRNTSVCIVEHSDFMSGRTNKVLRRIADLTYDRNSMIHPPIDEDRPRTFENRDLLYGKEGVGPDNDGVVGVWNWSATRRYSDETRDFIETEFEPDEVPIEAIFYNAISINALVDYLKKGIKIGYHSRRLLIYFHKDKNLYHCVFCNETNTNFSNGIVTIKPETVFLPYFKLRFRDFIETKPYSILLYRYFTIKETAEKVYIKSNNDIIRDVIKRRFSWSKAKGVVDTKRSWQTMKTFIDSFSNEIVEEIATLCSCSEAEAQEQLRNFIVNGDESIQNSILDYLSNDDLIRLLDKNPELNAKFQMAFDQINEQLSKIIEEKNVKLEDIEEEIIASTSEKESLLETIDELIKEKNKLEEQIARNQKLSDLAIEKLQERVYAVQKDAASVVEEFPLFTGLFQFDNKSDNPLAKEIEDESEKVSDLVATSPFTVGKDINDIELLSSWEEQIELLSECLEESGVNKQYAISLAAFLYMAHIYQIPVILAGPSGDGIADAVSAVLYGKTSSLLDCDYEYTKYDIHNIQTTENTVIRIKSPFNAKCAESVLSIIQDKSEMKDYYLLVPYADDLCIEPDGILNYAVPILTELFVTDVASGDIFSGGKDENFSAFEKSKKIKKLLPDSVPVISIAATYIQRLLYESLRCDLNISDVDFIYLFGIVPYLFVMNRNEQALEMIQAEKSLNSDIKKQVIRYLGGINE